MRAVVTRVKNASVVIDGKVNGSIETGFLVLLGVHEDDSEAEAKKIADKISRPMVTNHFPMTDKRLRAFRLLASGK